MSAIKPNLVSLLTSFSIAIGLVNGLTTAHAQPPAQETLLLAVASNFQHTAKALTRQYHNHSATRLKLVFGSTGKLYTQIIHGAPFAGLLAADQQHPLQLEQNGHIIPNSRQTYAIGRLALYGHTLKATSKPLTAAELKAMLLLPSKHKLAMANPRLAPYGQAAQQLLANLGQWPLPAGQLVMGENVSQAHHFVHSGHAQLGLIAWAQRRHSSATHYQLLPKRLHAPITQQAVCLQQAQPCVAFLNWLKQPAAQAIIRQHGYEVPE